MNKKTVLVIDDAIFMRTVLKRMIEETGLCQVVGEGTNGLEAVEKARELQPDIITMDIIMPEYDGLTAVKEIVAISPKSKIIMISSIGNINIVKDAIELGAYDYIVKPIVKEEIEKILNKIFTA